MVLSPVGTFGVCLFIRDFRSRTNVSLSFVAMDDPQTGSTGPHRGAAT